MTRVRSRLAAVAAAAALAVLAGLAPGALSHPFHPGATNPDTRAPGLRLDPIGDFNLPVYVTAPRDDVTRQFVVEQGGRIKLIKDGQILERPFLNLTDVVGFDEGERGLLSMAFAPDYATSGLFYVFYTDRGGDLRVDELKRSDSDHDAAEPASRRAVIRIEHSRYGNHNGGQLQFGADGLLYISTGDGGGAGDPLRTGQDLDSLLGKIVRVDPRRPSSRRGYSVPANNPFVGRSGRDEIWAYGLRNPWRFSFDRRTGDIAIGDVGQSQREEVDFALKGRKGMNFGWSCFEGTRRYRGCEARGHFRPALEYSHAGQSCSITGGFVVRDPTVRLYGRYVYGDYCTGALHAAILREDDANKHSYLDLVVPWLTGFGEDARGRLYATSRGGAVYRLEADG